MPASSVRLRRIAAASLIGSVVEWYDFYIYGTAAALVLGRLFFPTMDPTSATLSAFATFAVGFLARPVGGLLFGHLGDRVGRRFVLILTLLLMGGCTFAIGILPTYASIGMLAPVLLVLLRFLQGVAVGGEWGGAVLLGVERAPAGRKALYGSFAQVGSPVGSLLAAGVFAAVEALPRDALLGWGWRVPFLLSAALIAVGHFIRTRIEDDASSTRRRAEQLPLLSVLHRHWVAVLLGTGAMIVTLTGFYISTTFLTGYGGRLGFSAHQLLVGTMLVAVVQIAALPLAAVLADRRGRLPVLLVGTVASAALSYPMLLLAGTGAVAGLWLGMIVFNVARSLVYGPLPAFAAALFPSAVRFTGISLCYQLAGILGGGLAPLLAVALIGRGNDFLPVAGLLAATGVLSTLCVLAIAVRSKRGSARDHLEEPTTAAGADSDAGDTTTDTAARSPGADNPGNIR